MQGDNTRNSVINQSIQQPEHTNIPDPQLITQKTQKIQPQSPYRKTKNLFKLTIVLLVISLSSFYFGYSLTYLSTIPKSTLKQFYGPAIDNTSTLPILTGAMPFGAIFGSLLANLLMRYFTRRNCLVFINILALIVNAIIQITNIWVLFIFRLINGILVGLYLGLIPNYIKQLCPHSVSGIFGTFTQMQHLFGCVASYFVGMIFYLCDFQGEFFMRFQLEFTSIFIILQMVLIFIGYIPQSPNSLVQADRIQQAKNVFRMFNQQSQIERLIKQKLEQNDQIQNELELKNMRKGSKIQVATIQQSLITDIPKQIPKQNKAVAMNWKSYFLSFQLPFTQQLTGTNFIVTEMTAITALYDVNLSHFSALISNFIQFVATALSAYVFAKLGRRPIILIGNFSLAIVDLIIGIAFLALNILNWTPGFAIAITFIMIFNIFYGLFFGPVVWLYVAEIAEKKIVPLGLSMYWVGCTFCVVVPPIITTLMNSPYASFLFLSAWQFVFFIPNFLMVVETKGLSAAQITKKFKSI